MTEQQQQDVFEHFCAKLKAAGYWGHDVQAFLEGIVHVIDRKSVAIAHKVSQVQTGRYTSVPRQDCELTYRSKDGKSLICASFNDWHPSYLIHGTVEDWSDSTSLRGKQVGEFGNRSFCCIVLGPSTLRKKLATDFFGTIGSVEPRFHFGLFALQFESQLEWATPVTRQPSCVIL